MKYRSNKVLPDCSNMVKLPCLFASDRRDYTRSVAEDLFKASRIFIGIIEDNGFLDVMQCDPSVASPVR